MTIHYLAKKIINHLNPWKKTFPQCDQILELLGQIHSKQQMRIQLYKQKYTRYNLQYNSNLLPSVNKLFKSVKNDIIINSNDELQIISKYVPNIAKEQTQPLYTIKILTPIQPFKTNKVINKIYDKLNTKPKVKYIPVINKKLNNVSNSDPTRKVKVDLSTKQFNNNMLYDDDEDQHPSTPVKSFNKRVKLNTPQQEVKSSNNNNTINIPEVKQERISSKLEELQTRRDAGQSYPFLRMNLEKEGLNEEEIEKEIAEVVLRAKQIKEENARKDLLWKNQMKSKR